MAFTEKKRRFVDALRSGLTGKAAAIAAGYSEKGAAQAASRLMKDKCVLAALERHEHVNEAKAQAKAEGKKLNLADLSQMYSDPKDFLKALMNDHGEDMKLRMEAAKTLMPFVHGRKAPATSASKKEDALKQASTGRFAVPAAPPRMH